MSSLPAKLVAQEVLETVRRGERPNLGKIIRSKGYSKVTSTVPTQVTNTKSYREVIDPFVQSLVKERERAIRLMGKKISQAKYRDLVDATDKLTKNIQLLSGSSTENNSHVFRWE